MITKTEPNRGKITPEAKKRESPVLVTGKSGLRTIEERSEDF
mgnify:CR=1 FL=1